MRIPGERIGGREGEEVRYFELGKSESYGTSQFSDETVQAIARYVEGSNNGMRVNSIFGEGVSPRLRKIRQGLDLLNMPTDALLKHGRERIVYGIPLIRNMNTYLLGVDDQPDYISRLDGNRATREIVAWWREWWLAGRIDREGVLDLVRSHTLVRPIRHGARVVLPRVEEDQPSLFDDID